jgi:hypothetical protein
MHRFLTTDPLNNSFVLHERGKAVGSLESYGNMSDIRGRLFLQNNYATVLMAHDASSTEIEVIV